MALKCDIKKFGLVVEGAYLFINSVNYNRQLLNPAFNNPVRDNGIIGLTIFVNKEARDNKEEPLELQSINFTIKVCDDSNLCSTTNTSNFSINHIPNATNVNVTNSTGGNFFNTTESLNCDYIFTDADNLIYN